ncbi:MAG: insulinase family protein [Thermoplasmata archaeon]|jgi:zinc protease|nr:insulinase family protein [Thermoplasmata archaeon]
MSSASDPLRIEYADGPHGLRIARQSPPPGAASFSATYIGPGGWAYDRPGAEGTARMTAHLLPSGAGSRDRIELARYLDRAGGTLNAQCDPESAEVTVWGPVDSTDVLMGVLADAVLRPRFDATDLERVRRQLIERQLRELSQPGARADRELHRAIFPSGHPYRSTGAGDRKTVSRVRPSDLTKFHRQHFTGEGGILVVTTPRNLSSVVRLVGRRFSDLPARAPPPLSVPKPRHGSPRDVSIDLPGRSQVEVRLGGSSIARDDPSYAAAYLADEVLGGATLLSRLFTRVRSKGGLAYHASSHLEAMKFGGYWVAQAGTGGDRWRKVVPMLRQEVARITRETIPSAELDLIRESRIGEVALALESTSDAHELALEVAYYGLPGDYWVTWPSVLRGLSPAEVRQAAEVALDGRRAASVVVGPLGGLP